jgi:hypothetical protein
LREEDWRRLRRDKIAISKKLNDSFILSPQCLTYLSFLIFNSAGTGLKSPNQFSTWTPYSRQTLLEIASASPPDLHYFSTFNSNLFLRKAFSCPAQQHPWLLPWDKMKLCTYFHYTLIIVYCNFAFTHLALLLNEALLCYSAFCHCHNIPEITYQCGKRLTIIWLTISEVLLHGPMTLLLWACCSIVYHKGSRWQKRSIHFTVAQKQRKSKRETVS